MTEGRAANGRFAPGASGNPGGRPKRLLDLEAALQEAHDAPRVLEVIDMLRERALRGDVQAAKAYLDRVVGPLRDDMLIERKAQQLLDRLLAEAEARRDERDLAARNERPPPPGQIG